MGAQGAAEHSEALERTLTASRALLGLVAHSLAGVADAVTLPQFRVLVLLATRGPARMGDLAQLLGVHQSSFSRTADRLETAGLLVREQSPGSRREVVVSATAQGLRIVEDVSEARRREIAIRQSSAELNALRTALPEAQPARRARRRTERLE